MGARAGRWITEGRERPGAPVAGATPCAALACAEAATLRALAESPGHAGRDPKTIGISVRA
ncbi:MAG: type II toxin-antitoxin system HicB family antitoxin [Betaproteobacteria bacterium]|nr:MAG: type II toxin-antitoxin system HicB family antitoxin [Betaproteobacteria bacterium]